MALTLNHQTNEIINATGIVTVNGTEVGGDNTPKWYGSRAVMSGGNQPATFTGANTIDYVTVATTGNAQDFGDLVIARQAATSVSNGTRGLITGQSASNVIDYITISTTGNAQDFGDLSVARSVIGSSNGSTGIFAGGWTGGSRSNVIDTVTIATTGNATDFGDLITGRNGHGSCADSTRALFAGGLS